MGRGFDEFIEFLKEESSDRKRRVLREIPVRDEWKEVYDRLDEVRKEAEALGRRFKHEVEEIEKRGDHLHRKFWYLVERDTELHNEMSYDRERGIIKVYAGKYDLNDD